MTSARTPDADLQAAIDAYRDHGSYVPAAASLGLNMETFRSRLKVARRRAELGDLAAPPLPPAAGPAPGYRVTRNSGAYGADGKLTSQWIETKPDSGDEYVVPAGHRVKGESALVDPEGRVLAKWVKTTEDAGTARLIDSLRAVFGAYDGMAPLVPAPIAPDADLLTVYPIADLHFGMYSWAPETGADYDIDIASRVATEAVAALVSQSKPSKHAVILGLGDLFHANDQKNATPGSGHRLDVDGRWGRVFAAGAKLMCSIVDLVAQRHEFVTVVILPGNHDEDAALCLRVALSLFYSRNQRIIVDDRAGLHWYLQFGQCLLGATHGHTMKPDRMAMMLAVDQPKAWGSTEHRHMFFGHIHHESAKEVGGVRVESFNTLAARDAWAQGGGYRSGRAMSAITFHTDAGEVGRHRVNVAVQTVS